MARAPGIVETSSNTVSEPIDDIPLLLTYLHRIGLQQSIDHHFHSDLSDSDVSLGRLLVIWLAHMLTQSKRQARHLRSWVASHQFTLQRYVGQQIPLSAVSDIRLHKALTALGDDAAWLQFEAAFNKQLIAQHKIRDQHVHLSSASGQLYMTSEGILQFDQGRRWWSGAIGLRLTVCQLYPSGLPIAVVAAALGDERSAVTAEALQHTRSAISAQRAIYVSNSELKGDLRATLRAYGDGYVCKLDRDTLLATLAHTTPQSLQHLVSGTPGEPGDHFADGYEFDVDPALEGWQERRILVRNFAQLHQQNRDLDERLGSAQIELAALNERRRGKRRPRSLDEMQSAVEAILAQYAVESLLRVAYVETSDTRIVRRYRGRPTMPRTEHVVSINTQLDEAAVHAYRQQLGWRIFASNVPADELPIDEVAQIELDMPPLIRRVCGKPLSITAGIVHHEPQIRGLIRFVSLAMRTLALIDEALYHRAMEVGLEPYDKTSGNGQQLLAERLLEAYKELTLTVISEGYERRYHVTTLSSVQRRMLEVLGLPASIYTVRQ